MKVIKVSMKVIEVKDKSGMAQALDMAQYEKGPVQIKCGSFELNLRDPQKAGEWFDCVMEARNKALNRLRKQVKKAHANLFKVAV